MANTVDKVLKIAKNEVGYLEKETNSNLDSKTANAGDENYTKYARDLDNIKDFYNGKKNGYAWCDMFVDWCMVQAYGVEEALRITFQPKKSLGAGCKYSANYYKNNGRYGKEPRVGAQIFFKNSNGTIHHTGIVEKFDETYVYTIEGNTSSASGVVENGGSVEPKKYALSYARIDGYGYPLYDVVVASASSSTSDNKIDTIKEVQKWANDNYKSGLVVDGLYGAKTKKALVKILQTELNQTYKAGLAVDGVWGNKTRGAIRNLKKGSKDDVVKVLQAFLVCNKISGIYVDGDFGNVTEKAVKNYQIKKGLASDGIAGKDTFAKLCA